MRLLSLALLFSMCSINAIPYSTLKKKIQDTINNNTTVLVLFSKPSCPYCQYSLPIFHEAQRKLTGAATFLLIDDMQHAAQLKRDFNFNTFPTFIYFVNGKRALTHGSNNKQLTVAQVVRHVQAQRVV